MVGLSLAHSWNTQNWLYFLLRAYLSLDRGCFGSKGREGVLIGYFIIEPTPTGGDSQKDVNAGGCRVTVAAAGFSWD